MRYLIALAITVAFFLAAFALSAQAHSRTELDEWKEGWERAATARGVTPDELADYWDLMARHPWYRHPPQSGAVYRGMGSGVEAWRPLVAVWFPADQIDRALCVMLYESGGDPRAHSATDDWGLFQVNAPTWLEVFGVTREDLYDPETNTRLAADILRIQGWTAWSAWNRGRCA